MKRQILELQKGKIKSSTKKYTAPDAEKAADRKNLNRALSQAMELGLSIALPIVAGILFGRYLDHILNTAPILTLSFLFLGVIIGSIRIVRLALGDSI